MPKKPIPPARGTKSRAPGAARPPRSKPAATPARKPARPAARPRPAVTTPATAPPDTRPGPAAPSPTTAPRTTLPSLAPQRPPEPPALRLRTAAGAWFDLDEDATIQRDAIAWGHTLRNRGRWSDSEATRRDHSIRSRELLQRLGLGREQLDVLAAAGVAEVEIPFREEAEGWALRLLPWEFLLSSATRDRRAGAPLTVVRWLHRVLPMAPPRPVLARVLFVECAPGGLRDFYDFASERRLLDRSLGLEVAVVRDPTLDRLGETVRAIRPDLVHLAGCDNHQAAELLGLDDPESKHDGYAMLGETRGIEFVGAERLAEALTGFGGHAPSFVACNFFDSAMRVAPLAVAAGCGAAIGFQDRMDDELCEMFWSNFYAAWARSSGELVPVFEAARLVMRGQGPAHYGSGLALWSESSIAGAPAAAAVPPGAESQRLEQELRSEKSRLVEESDVRGLTPEQIVDVKVEAAGPISYALLHNGRGLFSRFDLKKQVPGRLTGVSVEVRVDFGGGSFPFRTEVELTEVPMSLAERVRPSLTSELSRTPSEAIRTVVATRVAWRGITLHESTESVTVLPADEWTDTDKDRQWLPSFVFRSDPAVLRVIDHAQRYLIALSDDPGAGFGGYQNIDPDADEPTLGVDHQVQAIWYALTHDHAIRYINPPPSTTSLSQRLRTPSDVLEGGRGTCIDLALMLAACLEYIDIHPAIVLLEGHAFPAYWRSDTAYDAFREEWRSGRLDAPISMEPGSTADAPATDRATWSLPAGAYRGLLEYVRRGDLVPIEAVWLTNHSSFAEALEEGLVDLRSKKDFHSMLDIQLAREAGITPLPLLRRRDP